MITKQKKFTKKKNNLFYIYFIESILLSANSSYRE